MKKLQLTELSDDEYYLIGNEEYGLEPAMYVSERGAFRTIGTDQYYRLAPDEFVIKLEMPFFWRGEKWKDTK